MGTKWILIIALAVGACVGAEEGRSAPPGSDVDGGQDAHGVVVTADGDPVRGAEVRLIHPPLRQVPTVGSWSGGERTLATLYTDARGEFRHRLAPDQLYDLVVRADARATVRLPDRYAGELVRVVLAPAATLHGRVTSLFEGAPLAGVELELTLGTSHRLGDARPRTTTDARGTYRFDNLPPGLLRIDTTASGHVATSTPVHLTAGEDRALDLALDPGTTIRGRVTDAATDLPLVGATVRNGWTDGPQRTTTAVDGTYELAGIAIGSAVQLCVAAPGYGEWTDQVEGVPTAGGTQDFFVLPSRQACGRIVDPRGEPVVDAHVAVVAGDRWGRTSQMDRHFTHTDEGGEFHVEDLRTDLRHSLVVRAEGFATGFHDFPAVEAESPVIELGDVPLAPPSVLAGRLVDPDGRPLAEHTIRLHLVPATRDLLGPSRTNRRGYPTGGGYGGGPIGSRTDARGRFRFTDLPAGRGQLRGGHQDYAVWTTLDFDLEEGEVVDDIELVLEPGLSIAGVLLDPEGRPLARADISAVPEHRAGWGASAGTLTAADGSFRLWALEPGTYTVTCAGRDGFPDADAPRSAERWSGIEAGTTNLVLRLPRQDE